MPVQTFPITSISRWGAWSVDRQGAHNVNSAMEGTDACFAFNFTGTQAEFLIGADTGADGYDNPAFSVSIDGGPPITHAFGYLPGGGAPEWQPMSADNGGNGVLLPDGPHTGILHVVYPYYALPDNWNIDVNTAIRVTGANPAASPLSYRPTQAGKIVVCDGDSRTEGWDASAGVGDSYQGTTYPAVLLQKLGAGWDVVNQGSYSDMSSHMLARQPTDVLTQFDPKNSRNVLIFWGGINDLGSGVTPQTMGQIVRTYVANARAKGVKEIILGTIPYTVGHGSAASNDAYNADLRANWPAIGATALYDADADPAFSGHVVTPDWNGDGLHFSDSGHLKLAAGFFNAMSNQVSVTSVAVSPAAPSVLGGTTQQFTVAVNGTGNPAQTVTWATSAGIITSAGLFTAPAATSSAQMITVTATSTVDATKSGTANVTVPALVITVTGVAVSPAAPTLSGGATQQFTAAVSGANGPSQSVTWATSVGTVTATGLYTAPAPTNSAQTATVTATSVQDATKSGAASVTVPGANPAVADLEFEIGAPTVSLIDPTTALVSGGDGFIHVPVSAKNAVGIPVDLTQQALSGAYVYPVTVCPTLTVAPPAANYQAGDWLYSNGVSYARLQVGPANPLAPANYRVYLQIAGEYTLFSPALLPVVA